MIKLQRGFDRLFINSKSNKMIKYFKWKRTLVFATIILASSCTETKTNTQEESQINTMDSTSKVLKENTEKLEEQTKKVEEFLEKLDKEFETNK